MRKPLGSVQVRIEVLESDVTGIVLCVGSTKSYNGTTFFGRRCCRLCGNKGLLNTPYPLSCIEHANAVLSGEVHAGVPQCRQEGVPSSPSPRSLCHAPAALVATHGAVVRGHERVMSFAHQVNCEVPSFIFKPESSSLQRGAGVRWSGGAIVTVRWRCTFAVIRRRAVRIYEVHGGCSSD